MGVSRVEIQQGVRVDFCALGPSGREAKNCFSMGVEFGRDV